MGRNSRADGDSSVAVGVNSQADGLAGVAVGAGAQAPGAYASAFGPGAQAVADSSVALGNGSVADRANTVSVGAAGRERQITNVAAGTAPTDAVNVFQLNAAAITMNDRIDGLQMAMRQNTQELNAGVAGAIAMANLPQASTPGKSMFALGVGAWQGEAGAAMGFSHALRDNRTIIKASASFTRQGSGGGAGVGFQF